MKISKRGTVLVVGFPLILLQAKAVRLDSSLIIVGPIPAGVSINSPSGEGGENPLTAVKRLRSVSINSPSGEGGELFCHFGRQVTLESFH
jgi:hypothetical protein